MDEDVIGAANSEVEALMADDKDSAEEKSEHESSPLDEISKYIVQTTRGQAAGSSAIVRGRSAVRGGVFFIRDHSVLFFTKFFYCKSHKSCTTSRNAYPL
jgi:hypothetical protein